MTPVWEEADVITAVRQVKDRVRQTFEVAGVMPPMAWLFATRDPDTDAPIKSLLAIPPMGVAGVGQRQTFPLLLRLAALKSAAVGLVFVAKATGRTQGSDPHDVLLLLMEHRTLGVKVWRAALRPDTGGGKHRIGDWEADTSDVKSRFLHLLPAV